MREFFDPESYVKEPIPHKACCGCGRSEKACMPTEATRQTFFDFIKIRWPEIGTIDLPIREDLECLGLNPGNVPRFIGLCIECTMKYMKDFNRLNAEHHARKTLQTTSPSVATEIKSCMLDAAFLVNCRT
jgi:hypothetical protein